MVHVGEGRGGSFIGTWERMHTAREARETCSGLLCM